MAWPSFHRLLTERKATCEAIGPLVGARCGTALRSAAQASTVRGCAVSQLWSRISGRLLRSLNSGRSGSIEARAGLVECRRIDDGRGIAIATRRPRRVAEARSRSGGIGSGIGIGAAGDVPLHVIGLDGPARGGDVEHIRLAWPKMLAGNPCRVADAAKSHSPVRQHFIRLLLLLLLLVVVRHGVLAPAGRDVALHGHGALRRAEVDERRTAIVDATAAATSRRRRRRHRRHGRANGG